MSEPAPSYPAKMASEDNDIGYGVRRFGRWNILGVWTLYKKEVRRYLKVAFQTVFAPIITTLLYLIVFMGAWGSLDRGVKMGEVDVSFFLFLPPGLIMMSILNNAFQNSSSSIIISKVQGTLVDVLMPPLSAAELAIAYVAGAATRGLMVGGVTALAVSIFLLTAQPMAVHNVWAIIFFALNGAILLASLGVLAGMWAEKFDQLALVTNFVIAPLTFLSGTFYSVKSPWLPDFVLWFSQINPLFYLIDGFRYGFIGVSDASPVTGAILLLTLNIVIFWLSYDLLKKGYKLKS